MTEPARADRVENEAFEALADCDACLVESAVVELIAQAEIAGTTQGVVLERRCRACLRESRAGRIVHEGESFRGEPARARAALERWARDEGDEDAARFVGAHFEHAIDVIAEQLARGERVQTCFDAIAWLFPGVGAVGGGGGGGGVSTPVAPIDGKTLETGPPAFDVARPEITWPDVRRHRASLAPMAIPVTHESIPKHLQPLRVSARALASVMLADGVADATDRAFVDRTLAAWGHPPIEPADLAVWRPHDLGWPHDPGEVVLAMCRLAYVDGQRDATEWRVVREFARSWGVSLEAVEAFGRELAKDNEKGLKKAWSSFKGLFVR